MICEAEENDGLDNYLHLETATMSYEEENNREKKGKRIDGTKKEVVTLWIITSVKPMREEIERMKLFSQFIRGCQHFFEEKQMKWPSLLQFCVNLEIVKSLKWSYI